MTDDFRRPSRPSGSSNVVELRPVVQPAAGSLDDARRAVSAFLAPRPRGETLTLMTAWMTTTPTAHAAIAREVHAMELGAIEDAVDAVLCAAGVAFRLAVVNPAMRAMGFVPFRLRAATQDGTPAGDVSFHLAAEDDAGDLANVSLS